jgi:hypothetical protein
VRFLKKEISTVASSADLVRFPPHLGPAAALSAACVAKGQPQQKLVSRFSQDRLAVTRITD